MAALVDVEDDVETEIAVVWVLEIDVEVVVTDLDVVTDETIGEAPCPGSADAGRRVALKASVC